MNEDGSVNTAKIYIDGNWIHDPQTHQIGESINPATGLVEAFYVAANKGDVDHAVTSARKAFDTSAWSQTPKIRSEVLRKFADRLEVRSPEISAMLVALNGKLKREADGEIAASVSELRYYSGLARNLFGRTLEIEPDKFSAIEREAIGVAAIIVPWNAPVTLLIRSLAPALAAGCTTVIKTAFQTALVHEMVMKCLVDDVDLPKGVVNWFTESGSNASELLCVHPEVDVISFTGSTAVGKKIAESTSHRLTRLSLELGGKAPAIVLPDANLDRSIKGVVSGACVMAGQMCTAISRVLVHVSKKDEVTDRLVKALKSVRVGPGRDATSEMGALIDTRSQQRLLGLIDEAKQKCTVHLAGSIPEGLAEGSSFLTPSVVEVDDLSSKFVQNELFGPIVTLETFSDTDEALHKANATRYGLASSIWTDDYRLAGYMARRLKFGNVWINAHNRLFAEVETGGYRESGIGRLHGVDGLADFMETKHVYTDRSQH